jgi:hypothetical protein
MINLQPAIGMFAKATEKMFEAVHTYPDLKFTAALATSLVVEAGVALRRANIRV